jgi:radical SAM superfamily enzyme YgiQ (UPF0313 family)
VRIAIVHPTTRPPRGSGGRLLTALGRRPPPQPPLEAASLAGWLRQSGHEPTIHDGSGDPPRVAADLVAIPATSAAWPEAARLAGAYPGLPVVVFGAHPTLFPEHALQAATYCVFGEPEDAFLELLEHVARGEVPRGVLGVGYHDGGTPTLNKPRPNRRHLDDLPVPAWDLVDRAAYHLPASRTRRSNALPVRFSRGCSHAECRYCARSGALKRPYVRVSPRHAAAQLAELRESTGVTEVLLVDDEVVVGGDWIREFCGELRNLHKPVRWACEVRPSQVDHSILRAMSDAGCHQVLIGMDVLNTPLLHGLEKDQTVAQCAQAVRDARHAALSPVGVFVVGLPGSSPAIERDSVQHALSHGLDAAFFVLYRPTPGSEGWDSLNWTADDYVASLQDPMRAVYVPDGFADAGEVERVFAEVIRTWHRDPRPWRNLMLRAATDPLKGRMLLRNHAAAFAAPYFNYNGLVP